MKIELSKNELKNLIELIYFGEFIFDSSREAYPEKKDKYNKLIQKIFKIAFKNGITDLKLYGDEIDVTRDFEDDNFIVGVVREYNTESFWENLMMRLATRDLLEKMSPEEYQNLDRVERLKMETELEEPYHEEFSKNGLKNLKILNTDLSFLRK